MTKFLTGSALLVLGQAASTGTEFNYNSLGRDWVHLNITSNQCNGVLPRQSPINFVPSTITKEDERGVTYSYSETPDLKFYWNTHDLKVAPVNSEDKLGSLEFDGQTYHALQYHFHASAEHVVDNVRRPLEMHIVHALNDGSQYAVLGFTFIEGEKENKFLAKLIENGIPTESQTKESYIKIKKYPSIPDLLDKEETIWHYKGSLTTPPCTEAVMWFFVRGAKTATLEQLEKLAAIHSPGNYRTAQNDKNTDAINNNISIVKGKSGAKGQEFLLFTVLALIVSFLF